MKKKNDIWIKVLSLGVGLAVAIVLIAKVFFELSYDSFYKDVDRVYIIKTGYRQQGESHDYGQVSGATAPGFKAEVPGVESATRTTFVFNEDTYLDARMGEAMVRGYQGNLADSTSMAACIKHFVGYGAAEGGRDYNSTYLTERQLRNVYLPPFEAAVKAGALTLMTSFNDNDGVPNWLQAWTLTG